MKNTIVALFLLALTGNVFASNCAANTTETKTEEELKKEMEQQQEVPATSATPAK